MVREVAETCQEGRRQWNPRKAGMNPVKKSTIAPNGDMQGATDTIRKDTPVVQIIKRLRTHVAK